ncbi:MAG: translation elongation factor Ts [Bacteroidota bacterium]|nr:translation elongation factor Ts [Bacteroidota bacterium]
MGKISASEVNKLRKMTGAGMMDCKKALTKTDGDFDKAVKVIREKGQAIANKRSDREATEGVVLAATSANAKTGMMIALNCETDFVAKNESFINIAKSILNVALENNPADLDALKKLELDGKTIEDVVIEQTGIIGEKVELAYFDKISDEQVTAYIHSDNKLATLVSLNKAGIEEQVGRDVAMQAAAMNPIALDKDDVPQDVIDGELEIGKKQAIAEGKPENLIEKIAMGKLGKYYKENTLLNQAFIKENKMSVKQYLQNTEKELTVTAFKRYSLK